MLIIDDYKHVKPIRKENMTIGTYTRQFWALLGARSLPAPSTGIGYPDLSSNVTDESNQQNQDNYTLGAC
jgi:hypothetical protein